MDNSNVDILGNQTIAHSRRSFLKVGGVGIGSLVLAGSVGSLAVLETACAAKDIAFYVDTVIGALKQLSPLLPGAAGFIAKAISIAGDLKAAYEKGDFANTSALFASLSDVMGQIADDAGVSSPSIKLIFAIAGVALNTIGALLKAQTPAMAAKVGKVGATSEQLRGADLIERATARADAVFAAVKP